MTNRYYAYVMLKSVWVDVNVARSSFRIQSLDFARLNGQWLSDDELSRMGFAKKPRAFQLISPSRHLCDGCCVGGIIVLTSPDSSKPLYRADELDSNKHILPSIWGEPAESSAQSNFCSGIVGKARQWLGLGDGIDYALTMDKTAQPPRGNCAVSCEASVDILMAQLDIDGEFDPERLFLLQSGITEGRARQRTFGRHEGKLWEYRSDAQAAALETDDYIYYNCSKSNDWSSNEILKFPLDDIEEESDHKTAMTTHFCHVSPDGTVTTIGS